MFKKLKTKIYNWYYDIKPDRKKYKTKWFIPNNKAIECYELWNKFEKSHTPHEKRLNRLAFWNFAYKTIPELVNLDFPIIFIDGKDTAGIPYFKKLKK